ncbi:MAG: hypothetical protein JKY70_22520 [Mucilaginibacter sp.]|nr:hypothetical protein [Mucilaginibacter sp.]
MFRIRDYLNDDSLLPHRHHYYMLLWIREGMGSHQVDFNTYEMLTNAKFPVAEGHVHRIIQPPTDGWMITFRGCVFNALHDGKGGILAEELF